MKALNIMSSAVLFFSLFFSFFFVTYMVVKRACAYNYLVLFIMRSLQSILAFAALRMYRVADLLYIVAVQPFLSCGLVNSCPIIFICSDLSAVPPHHVNIFCLPFSSSSARHTSHFPSASLHALNGRLCRCSTLGRMYHTNITAPKSTHNMFTM